MNCKKCGRPMSKDGTCTYCERKNTKQQGEKTRKIAPYWYGVAATVLIAVIVIAVVLLTGGDKEKPSGSTQPTAAPTISGKHHVEIEIADYGVIAVELDADAAPVTVENFLKLAKDGFYDGLTFHRIMSGFMMQGGDPEGNGSGGSDVTIKGEFSENGVSNPLSHTRGAISMARNGMDMDSATSQFFIVHQDSLFLDGKYACFGYVTSGLEVVDAVCADAKPTDNNGSIPTEQQPIITEIRVLD